MYKVWNLLQGIQLLYVPGYNSLDCIQTLPPNHALKLQEIAFTYLYFLNKVLDFADTIFFVLRKNYKQISFLHVYHHVLMVLSTWSALAYYGSGGNHVVTSMLNSFVHVCMYGYYWLSANNPKYKYSALKRNITHIQFVQFALIFLHNAWAITFRPDCNSPKFLMYWSALQSLIISLLFGNFYLKSYLKYKLKSV